MLYNYFIGRYQPLHQGHIKLIRKVLDEGEAVCVALRNTGKDEQNPYSILERKKMFRKEFEKEIAESKLIIIVIPDIKAICYGREVGWNIREIRLDEATESISATEIRKKGEQ